MNQIFSNQHKKNRGETPAENGNFTVNYNTPPQITKRKIYNLNLLKLRNTCDYFIQNGYLLSEDKDLILARIRENRTIEKQVDNVMGGGEYV